MCYIAASNCKSGYLCTTSCSHLCVFIYLFILDADDLDDGDDVDGGVDGDDEDDGDGDNEILHELPPEAGFMWWIRCVFSSSSTI